MSEPAPLPPGARQLVVDDYLAAIGELYLQNRLLRLSLAQLAPPPPTEASNGTVHMDAGAR